MDSKLEDKYFELHELISLIERVIRYRMVTTPGPWVKKGCSLFANSDGWGSEKYETEICETFDDGENIDYIDAACNFNWGEARDTLLGVANAIRER